MEPWSDPPSFPSLTLPEAPVMPAPVLEVPRAKIPSYKPLVVPPSDLRPPPGVRGENEDKSPDKTKTPQPKEVQIYMRPLLIVESGEVGNVLSVPGQSLLFKSSVLRKPGLHICHQIRMKA